jgi:cell wall-associated NlpC family hydrolase
VLGAGIGSALLVPATPAIAAAATTSTSIGPTSANRLVDYYTAVTVTATVRSASGAAVPNRPVEFWQRPAGTTTWHKVVTRTTTTAGKAAYAYRATRSFYWQLRSPASATYAASSSSTPLVQARSLGVSAIREAATHRGKPYSYGATGPSRFDCSGFTMYVFRQFGRGLPHNSGQQAGAVRAVSRSAKRVGDLIFTYNSSGHIYHVGIYAGNNEIWHAPHSGEVVQRSRIWTANYRVGRIG